MSSVWRVAVAVAALTIAAAAALAGQTPDEQARLDRLARRYEILDARLTRAGGSGGPRVDSVQVAGVWILSDSLDHPVLRPALETFRRLLANRLGDLPLPVLADARIFVRFGPAHPALARLLSADTQLIAVQQRHRTREWLTDQLAGAVSSLLVLRGGASVTTWHPDLRLFQDPAPLLELTHLELLTANVPSARGCYEGSVAACARGLNLTVRLTEGSAEGTAELRRFVAQRLRHRATEPALAPSFAACVDGGDGAACLAFLDRAGVQEPTLTSRAAGTLLIAVADLGGAEALRRFFADTGLAIVPRLEAAAAMPLDSLLARWHAGVLANRPTPTSVPAGLQWFALVWTAVLVALATRSTRWR